MIQKLEAFSQSSKCLMLDSPTPSKPNPQNQNANLNFERTRPDQACTRSPAYTDRANHRPLAPRQEQEHSNLLPPRGWDAAGHHWQAPTRPHAGRLPKLRRHIGG